MSRRKANIRWVPLQGTAKIEPTQIHYSPVEIAEGPEKGQIRFTILKSDRYFQNGNIDFEMKLTGKDNRCQFVLNHGLEQQVFVGFNFGSNAYGMAFFKAGTWEPIATSGMGDTPRLDDWIKVSIVAHGSSISLFVDGVKVLAGQAVLLKSQVGIFLHGTTDITIRNVEIHDRRPKAFIVMQFTEEFDALYSDVIRPTCEKYGYEAIRGDDIYNNGLIIKDITTSLQEASVIIADITPDNPNVYYEVGYAHAINKPTILLCERAREKLPFDVSGFRTLFYDNSIGGKNQIEERLAKHLDSIKG